MNVKEIKNKVIHGNCIKIMQELPPGSVDIILTDPPYKNEDIKGLGAFKGDYYKWLRNWLYWAERAASEYTIFFNGPTRLSRVIQECGEPYRIIMWIKGVVKYPWRWEPIFIYRHPTNGNSFSLNRKIWSDTLPYQPLHSKQVDRKYQKPIKLMDHLIRYIPKGMTVMDPFCGTGQTLIACKKAGLDYIGIDTDKEACKLAKKRLAETEVEKCE